jgi:hypothetical protein
MKWARHVDTAEGTGCFLEGDTAVLAEHGEKTTKDLMRRKDSPDSRRRVYRGATTTRTVESTADGRIKYYLRRWFQLCDVRTCEVQSVQY